jgi:catechol 2,3-dioxygenase-like lactoylglutathione lyase family enzyme
MSESVRRPGSLGPIACVTVTVPDLDATAASYSEYLGYRAAGRGLVGGDLADLWGCEALADSRYLLLSPAAGDNCILRFVEAESSVPYVPFSTYGWNAAELMVQNVDEMADRLANSPFEIIGAPANLSFTDDIRAMQILGPGKELLYLTEFKKAIPGFDTPVARCPVDVVFIVILGGPSMTALQAFYAEHFGVPEATPVESRVKGMSAAFGNSPEHKYPIAALPLAGQALIEVDEMPAQATARENITGCLPPGIAMVSFMGRGLAKSRAREIVRGEPPYKNAMQVTCQRGVAGELVEVIHLD